MKNFFFIFLSLSTICSAQIDNKTLNFHYVKPGVTGQQIQVKFLLDENDSVTAYKTIDKRHEYQSKISKTEYLLLISELDAAIKLKPEQEEFICSHGNQLDINYNVNGKHNSITSSCISIETNSWSLRLLNKFLSIIGEAETK